MSAKLNINFGFEIRKALEETIKIIMLVRLRYNLLAGNQSPIK